MADVNSALIAFIGVLAGGYLNNFLAEDYRRFRDGNALAGALAGELASHTTAFPVLVKGLKGMVSMIQQGTRPAMHEFLLPNDPVYESGVGKLGLLDSRLAEEVAFAYQQIRAFRLAYQLITKEHGTMKDDELSWRIRQAWEIIERNEIRAARLVSALQAHARAGYLHSFAVVRWANAICTGRRATNDVSSNTPPQ